MLILSRKSGEALIINEEIEIKIIRSERRQGKNRNKRAAEC